LVFRIGGHWQIQRISGEALGSALVLGNIPEREFLNDFYLILNKSSRSSIFVVFAAKKV